jgi:hypothetical protein
MEATKKRRSKGSTSFCIDGFLQTRGSHNHSFCIGCNYGSSVSNFNLTGKKPVEAFISEIFRAITLKKVKLTKKLLRHIYNKSRHMLKPLQKI